MKVVLFVACFVWCWSHIYTSCDVSPDVYFSGYKVECFQISEIMDFTELVGDYERSNTNRLIIMNSSISTLPANFCSASAFLSVRLLFLEGNNIKTIQTGAFDTFHSLAYLYLGKNRISTISDDLFKNFRNARYFSLLSLKENMITTINIEPFKSLENLVYLDLSGNPIKVIGNFSQSGYWNKLGTLALNNTLIERFAYDFTKGHLKTLNLSCNQVQTIDFSKLPTVEIVDLSFNFIQNWTNPTSRTKMMSLDLSSNSLSSFFHNQKNPFRGMYELRELYLKNTSFNSIPIDFFQNLTNLTVLDLSYNQISQFKFGTFSKMIHLNELNVQHNQLTSIYELNPLVTLNKLFIDYNHLDLMLGDIQLHFQQLRDISFSHNPWSCRELVTAYHELKKSGVSVWNGDSFDVENLHGIPCSGGESTAVSENKEQPRMNQQCCKNVAVQSNEGEAEKLKFYSTLKAENNAVSGVSVAFFIVLFILVSFVGCMTYIQYKMFVKYIVCDSRERILMQENLI